MAISGQKLVRTLVNHRTSLMAYILSIVHDDQLAEDIFQDVCVLAYEKQEQIENQQHLLGWLRIAARYEAMKALRKRACDRLVFDSAMLDLLDGHWQESDRHSSTETIQALRHCIDRLTDYSRKMIKLRYADGVSGTKLAEIMERKLNTVYVALTRIHKTLAECIYNQLRSSGRYANE